MFQTDFSQQRQAQDDAVNAIGAAVGILPPPEQKANHDQTNEDERRIFLCVLAYRQHEQRDGGQLCVQAVEQFRELGHHVGEQKRHHDQYHADQQRGINQRHRQLLAEGHGQALEVDIAGQDLVNVAAFFAGHQRGGVDLGNHALRGEGVGEQLAAAHPFSHIFEDRAQIRVFLPFDQEFERIQNGQSGSDEREKLLVENQERRLLQAPAAPERHSSREQPLRLDPIDQVALRRKPVAHFGLGIAVLHLLVQVTALVRHFYYKFRHVACFLVPGSCLPPCSSLTFRY